MENIYFIGGPLNGTHRTAPGTFMTHDDFNQFSNYTFWRDTQNLTRLYVHTPPGHTLGPWRTVISRVGFLEELNSMVRQVKNELFDRGGSLETLDIDIKPEVIFDDDGEVALVYKVSGTALEVS